MTIVDSCIILDITNNDTFTAASEKALIECAKRGQLYAPDIVFSEVCTAYPDVRSVQKLFRGLEIKVVRMSRESLFLAATSYLNFLKRNKRTSRQQIRSQKRILPDFYIGALATSQGIPLLTRDLSRKWTKDFPTIHVLTP